MRFLYKGRKMTRRKFIKKTWKVPMVVSIATTFPSMAAKESSFVPPACRNNPDIPACKDRR